MSKLGAPRASKLKAYFNLSLSKFGDPGAVGEMLRALGYLTGASSIAVRKGPPQTALSSGPRSPQSLLVGR